MSMSTLILLNPTEDSVWLDSSGHPPQVPLPSHQAEVEGIVDAGRKKTGLEIVVLVCLRYEKDSDALYVCSVLDSHNSSQQHWHPLGSLPPAHLKHLNRWLDSSGPSRIPWSNAHWYYQVRQWLRDNLPPAGYFSRNSFKQVRCWSMSSIMKIPTDSETLYLKAVPSLFSVEADLVRWLGQLAPEQVPEVIASEPERGWFVTRDFGGANLSECEDYSIWKQALQAYAQLQIKTTCRTSELLSLGCMDRRLPRLIEHCHQLAEYFCRTSTEESGLSRENAKRWRRALPRLKELAAELESLGIPYALEHGDLHCGNIQVADEGFVFFDWTDGCIAHPFFSLEPFLVETPREPVIRSEFVQAYLEVWQTHLPHADCQKALKLARVLAMAHQTWSYYLITRAAEDMLKWQLGDAVSALARKTLNALAELGRKTR